MLDVAAHRIVGRRSPNKAAVLSIDVEHDYNGDRADALDRLPDLLSAVRRAELPLTAFVEGRLFTERPDLCAALVESGADVQLHCHDHRDSGDSAESLGRGVAAYKRFVGVPPRGYRAHTYRLTEALFAAVVREDFAWDSSILPGFGLGAHRHPAFRRGEVLCRGKAPCRGKTCRPDYFVIGDSLVEFPVASWRALGVPFTHSYRQLMGGFVESLLSRAMPLPRLLVYCMHLVDLFPDGRIWQAPLPLWLRSGHALVRRRQRGLDDLVDLAERLRGAGYEWTTLSRYHEGLTDRIRR